MGARDVYSCHKRVGFDLGSVKEIVEHNKTGFVINNVNKAVKYVKKIDQIKRINCRKLVEEKFTVEKMVEGYEKVYKKILSLQKQV